MVPQTIGILGGGQLGRMLALAGIPLNITCRVLDPSPDAPARVVAEHIVAPYDDADALQHFAEGIDVVTYEFENVPESAAVFLSTRCPVYPPPAALAHAQDRLVEKEFFHTLGIPTAPFANVCTLASLEQAVEHCGLPAILKTRTSGYDGKGQVLIHTLAEARQAWESLGKVPCILEEVIPFARELALLTVRSRTGNIAYYQLVETHQQEGMLRWALAPAPDMPDDSQVEAEKYASAIVQTLDYVGVLALELFQTETGALVANEMAPRVHNSGHWTIEGAETSQFANHMRAIAGLPLGSTQITGICDMENIIGTLPDCASVLADPVAHLHLYGKAPRPGRKLGHITRVRRDHQTPERYKR